MAEDGYLKVCKDTPPGTTGTFQFDVHVHYPYPYRPDYDVSTQINAGECQTLIQVGADPLISLAENLAQSPGWHVVSATVISDDDNGATGPWVTSEWTQDCVEDGTGCGIGQSAGTDVATAANPITCWIDPWHGCVIIIHNAPDETPPPVGKTFTIGPSSMEGHLKIPAGSWFNGGYSFKFVSNTHSATQFTVASKVEVPVTCPYGGGPGGTITIPLGTVTYNVPAGNTSWLPTGDANSILSWMGAVRSPDLCGGFPMDNARGAIFTATVLQTPASGSLVDFRFKYRDPAAKGKVDTNCTDPSEPKRNDAATCGASWSQTVRDP